MRVVKKMNIQNLETGILVDKRRTRRSLLLKELGRGKARRRKRNIKTMMVVLNIRCPKTFKNGEE